VRIVVFGATGGTGRAVVARALDEGHVVTAFARDPSKLPTTAGLFVVEGDAMRADDVARALQEQDAVVMALGNPQGSLARLFGARRRTAPDICEVGTRHIVDALPADSDTPIVVVSAFGVGETRDRLPLAYKLFFRLFLREQIADKERQEAVLKRSRLNYVLVQPAALTDAPESGSWTASQEGILGRTEVSREDLAAFILKLLKDGIPRGRTIAFSG
jgi:uncharacterized protein YbjT (DUF2867 family)